MPTLTLRNVLCMLVASVLLLALPTGTTAAKQPRDDRDNASVERVSPARRINRHASTPKRRARHRGSRFRTIDGRANNLEFPETGAAGTQLLRLTEPDYGDGISSLAGAGRASARWISNELHAQFEAIENPRGATDFLWQWGQFVDHDIDLSDGTDPPEPANIAVPNGDPHFDPFHTGSAEIPLNRSLYDAATGTSADNPRQQLNEISSWIDASNVYGSNEAREHALRTNDGTGRLRVSDGQLLPFNTAGFPNAGGSGPELFLAGDVRANEQVALTAMHTLFVREHNRVARDFKRRHPRWRGDRIYEHTRRRIGALMQHVTYREFLPALLGPNPLPPYRGYDASLDAGIANEFSAGAYRFGHSALSPLLLRLDAEGNEIDEGHLALRDAFFRTDPLYDEGGIDPLLRGLAAQTLEAIDTKVIDDVRNFLFGPPGAGGFDLAALNLQRGRDHGLASYNAVRIAYGFAPATDWSDISSDPDVQADLAAAYAQPDDVDLWSGGLSEDAHPGSHLGPLFHLIVAEQFQALRDGDRFWYERALPARELRIVRATRLSDVIRRNTGIGVEIQDDVFHLPQHVESRASR